MFDTNEILRLAPPDKNRLQRGVNVVKIENFEAFNDHGKNEQNVKMGV